MKNDFHLAGLNISALARGIKQGVSYYSQNLQGGVEEAKELVINYGERWKERTKSERAFSVARVGGFAAILPAVMALDVDDFSSFAPKELVSDYVNGLSNAGISDFTSPESLLGGIAFTCAFMMSRFRDNAHVDAYDALFAVAIGAQSIAIGANEYAAMAFAFFGAAATCSMMPEEKVDKYGKNIVYGFIAAGTATIATMADNWQEALPIASLITGGLATYKVGKNSFQARPWNIGGNTSNIAAATMSTGSVAAIASSVALMLNCSVTIKENDIPLLDKHFNKMSKGEKIGAYIKAVLNSDNRQEYLSKSDIKAYKNIPNLRPGENTSLNEKIGRLASLGM